jgi:hypothetical protein
MMLIILVGDRMLDDSDCSVEIILPAKPQRSRVARRIQRWGNWGHNIGRAVASVCLIAALAHTALSSEQLPHRLVSLIFIGLLPLACYLAGYLVLKILSLASAIYDPVSASLQSAWRIVCVVSATVWRGYIRPAIDIAHRWLAAVGALLFAAYMMARRSWSMIARTVSAHQRLIVSWLATARQNDLAGTAIRTATAPVRLFAHLLMKIVPPAGQLSGRSERAA